MITKISTEEIEQLFELHPAPVMKMGELLNQREKHENGLEYFFYIDDFYMYLKLLPQIKKELNKMINKL